MANDFFRFKQFTVHQGRCAMKVGTDGVLIGAWAHGGKRILDIGTGTGVVALMMAQRFGYALVDAVEVDTDAAAQAAQNFGDSPFKDRLWVGCTPVQQFAADKSRHGLYDAIVSNPPFFTNALHSPSAGRTVARHAVTLPYDELFGCVDVLLAPQGVFSVVIPFDCIDALLGAAAGFGFGVAKRCDIRTTPTKTPRRHLLALGRGASGAVACEGVLEDSPGVRSAWYRQLMQDFYL